MSNSHNPKNQYKEDDTGFTRAQDGKTGWFSILFNGTYKDPAWGRPFRNARWAVGMPSSEGEPEVPRSRKVFHKWRRELMACVVIVTAVVVIVPLFTSGVVLPNSSQNHKNQTKYPNQTVLLEWTTQDEGANKAGWTTSATPSPQWSHSTRTSSLHLPILTTPPKSNQAPTNNSNNLPSFLSKPLSIDISNGGQTFMLLDESAPVPLTVTNCLDFYSFHDGKTAADGKLQSSSINNVETCKEACDNNLFCTAFSFNRDHRKCYLVTTRVTSLQNAAGFTFYIRHGCHYCLLFEKRERTHAYGGQEQDLEIDSEEKCFSKCASILMCWGLDFSRESSRCYLHFRAFSPVSSSGNIVQYGRIGCDSDCRSGYSVNRGIDIAGSAGSYQPLARDLAACRRICDSQPLCQSFSYRFNDNTCRLLLSAAAIIVANRWATFYNKPFCTMNNRNSQFQMRLVGGITRSEGRVEIEHKGRWGTICDDQFTDKEAAVICNQLGLGFPAKAVGGAFYGEASADTPIWLDDLNCSAVSDNLRNCTSRGWGIHNCRHHEDVGVACGSQNSLNWQVRLNGGRSHNDGHVQVRLNNSSPWYFVCDDYWDYVNSDVVCKQLGLGNFSYAFTNSNFGETEATFLLDDVRCDAGMTSLRQCSHRMINSHDCRSHEIAGVQCFFHNTDRPSTNVRLSQGASSTQGRLEVYYNAEWGTVCDDSFDNVDASVICRELGFKYGQAMPCCRRFPQGRGSIWLDSVECDQDHRSVFDCKHDGWGRHDCTHSEDIGLECFNDLEVRLMDGQNQREGRVEVKHQGQWGTVCDDSFGNVDALVICRMLGYIYGEVKRFPVGYGPIWLDDVECSGNEREIFFCDHNPWGEHNCTHSEDVGVICFYRGPLTLNNYTEVPLNSTQTIGEGLPQPAAFTQADETCYFDQDLCDMEAIGWKQYSNFKVDSRIRLVGGRNEKEGRVEVLNQGQWGTICHNFWDDNDARAVCKMFGYQSGTAACCNRFGQGSGRIWLDQVNCSQSAQSLWECLSPGWGFTDCTNREDAGVVCVGEKPQPTTDVTYISTDKTSPISTLTMKVKSARCVRFKYRMPRGLYIYAAGAESQAFTPFTFNPIKAGGVVVMDRTTGNKWKEAEVPVSSTVRIVFLIAVATNGSYIHITNITSTQSACSQIFTCSDGMKKCNTVQQCYPAEAQCDGIYDCLDGSDERLCHPPYYDCTGINSPDDEITTTTLAPSTTPKPRRCLEKTFGGNAKNAICYFPFKFRGKMYDNCTTESHKMPWCATTDNFDRDRMWGNCGGCVCPEKTIEGLPCVFPFRYKSKMFYTCTTLEFSQPWCSLTSVFNGKWGICVGCDANFTGTLDVVYYPQCVPYTRRGNAKGVQCHFPFIYKGSQYFSCTDMDEVSLWCAVVPNYDHNPKWGLCAGCSECVETTILGNDGGNRCSIPFIFKGNVYRSCTKKASNSWWCATTPNYDTDQKWGVCNGGCDDDPPKEEEEDDDDDDEENEGSNEDGNPVSFVVSAVSCRELTVGGNAKGERCIFPFLYEGVVYRSCTMMHHHRPWCSVTFNYDVDGFWGNCIGCPVKGDSSTAKEDTGDVDENNPSRLARPATENDKKCSGKILSFNDGSLDGGVQSSRDTLRWKNSFGNTPTNRTGPILSRDYLPMTSFTLAKLDMAFQLFSKKIDLVIPMTVQGRYIYAEMSDGAPGDTGTISFTPPSGSLYLRFHYHMTGKQVGSLSVAVDDTVIWKVEGDQAIDLQTSEKVGYPSSWRFAQVALPTEAEIVDFTATKGPGPEGDIALDSVVFSRRHPYADLSCPTSFFRCGDGGCIPGKFICDGIRHCGLNEDESDCPETTCKTGFFNLCANGRCLPRTARCDGIVDCLDRSDEISCGEALITSEVCDGFSCGDGQCIGSQYRCDQIDHCDDGTDENCESSTALFHCSYGQVLTLTQRCNGILDCLDASDEVGCGDCAEYALACGDFCVPPSQVCNGLPDCPTGADEAGSCECQGDQMLCDGSRCISRENFCDGQQDCQDGSDEPEGCQCHPLFHMICGDGTCVGWSKRCDGRRECPDYSDEIECGDCKSGWRKCDVDYCIQTSQWCDGITHCPDSSDEKTNCTCEADQFACGDRCVPMSHRCDKKIDCSTSLDEMGCSCSHNEKPCENGVCLEESKFCNGFFDCEDGSDEFQCKCAIGQFPCTNGLCINASWRCNNYDNCGDESDEIGCPCNDNEYICNSTGRCIAREYRCDGVKDCANGEDEMRCAPSGPASCSPNEIPCNFTCVSKSFRCNGVVDCAEIPAGSDETKCIKQQALNVHSRITYVVYVEKDGENYVICYDGGVWSDQWSQAVCQQLGRGPPMSASGVPLSLVGYPRAILLVSGSVGEYIQKSLTPRDSTQCASSQAVAVVCHPSVCGQRAKHLNIPNTLIVGGEMSHPGMWPWQAQLKIAGQHNCGATLLNEHWAVTAAHCVMATTLTEYMISVGSIYRTKEDPNRQTRYVSKIVKHPAYNNQTFESDIALMKLGLPVTLTNYIRPACLPRPGEEPAYQDECQLTGWGRLMHGGVTPERLRDARFTIWNDIRCASNHSSYRKNTMLCAGKSRHFASACFGDSGGPLICRDANDRWTLTGIVSWAATPCEAPPTFYTRVSAYTDWIEKTMERLSFV